MKSTGTSIEIQNVSFSYDSKRKILADVSFNIAQGQIVGLLGPNGCGKTTLFKIISSLIRSYQGEIRVEGFSQKTNLRSFLSYMGVVFQSPSLDKKLTVRENLLYQAALYGIAAANAKKNIDSLLENFSLVDRRDEIAGNLSGGLARRVEIIKSLLHSPKVLIMDEPSTGLDIGARIELWNLLQHIRNTASLTVLLTTHLVEEADKCDRILLMNDGKIISDGSPNDLKKKMSFKQFHVKSRNLSFAKDFLAGNKINFDERDERLEFRVSSNEEAQKITFELSKHAEEITLRDPSLEDVFLFHTGKKIEDVQR